MGPKRFHIGKEEIACEDVRIAFKTNHESEWMLVNKTVSSERVGKTGTNM